MPLSTNAPFNEFGQSMILRDIEQLYLSLNAAGNGSAGDGGTQDQAQGVSQESGEGGLSVDLSGLATTAYVDAVAQSIIDSLPDLTLSGDVTGVAGSTTVEKIRGVSVSATAPADWQTLVYNDSTFEWEPTTIIANNGGLLTKDGTGLIEIAGGTALSVVGNATNTTGAINAIPAASADTVLGRRGTTLTWAKVAKAEMADAAGTSVIGRSANTTGAVADITAGADDTVLTRLSGTLSFASVSRNAMANGGACSVIGRSANSTGVVADISAGSNDTVLGRRSNAITWAKVSRAELADGSAVSLMGRSANSTGAVADISGAANQVLACNSTPALAFSRTITLGDTSNAGSLTIGNATASDAIVISPTLVTTTGKKLSIREIDVCDAGVAKKMLVLASAPY